MNMNTPSPFKAFSVFAVSLFLLIMLLSAFFIIPKANHLFESVHDQDVKKELALEATLFTRYIESQQSIIQDLASYPSLTNAAMMSDANNRAIQSLFENVIIGGKKSHLVLQDIAGTVLIQTDNELLGNYSADQPWIEQILSEATPYHLKLLAQKGSTLRFKMSVPILYQNFIEGILSSEISVPLEDVFVTQSYNKVAFKLVQDGVSINTGTDLIEIQRESSMTLPDSNIVFTYITDDSLIYEGKRTLQNTILTVLLISFTISFLLFAFLGYRSLRTADSVKIKTTVWKTYSIAIVVGFIGISASIAAYMIASNIKMSALEKELITESKTKVKAIHAKIESNLQTLDSLKAFYNASDNVSRAEFKTFVTPLFANHQNIQALDWVPYVVDQQRDLYKKVAKSGGINNFYITEKNDKGELILAKNRDAYFPVYFVEPLKGNENALGFDLASNSQHLAALTKAKLSGYKVATGQVSLVQTDGTQSGMLVFNPVYDNNVINNDIQNEKKLLGFVLLVLKVADLINDASLNETGNLLLFVEDITEPDNIETIYGVQPLNSTFSLTEIISVAGRSWRITTHNATDKQPLVLSAWLVLIAGIMLTTLITFGIGNLIRRREIVEQLVNSRTAELKDSEEQNRAVVNNAVDGFLTIDEIGIIEKFNHAAERIFGYTADDVIGHNIEMLIPPSENNDAEGDSNYIENYSDTGIQQIINISKKTQGRRKNGVIFPIELSIGEMEHNNRTKFIGIIRDISERVALEQERENFIDKLTDSNEELARFAFVCSHDLQEPLRMVRSFSEKLQKHLADDLKDDAKGQKYFNFVIDGAARSQQLITDILAYSSISSDTQILETVNIEKIIGVIENNMVDASGESKGEITFDKLPELKGNKTQLFQLFQNLINNGLKYQKPETVPHVHVGVVTTDTHWIFAVTDNGIGMEARHLTKIFEVFQRLHRRSQYAGTGVGLSICKKVVERHGGTIWVESEKGVGSTFYIKFIKPSTSEKI
jgi:PAS domain S-box-containing protein